MKTQQKQDEQRSAVAELIAFIEQYSFLLSSQLQSVRADMAATFGAVMEQITQISLTQGASTKMADEVLIKPESQDSSTGDNGPKRGDTFVSTSAHELDVQERQLLTKELATLNPPLSINVVEVGTKLRQHMQSLDHLDKRLGSMLMTMMGALSADDVVGQRIEHVVSAFQSLKNGLSKLDIGETENFSAEGLEAVKAALKQELYGCYTMESEKQVFVSVFGNISKK